MLTSIIQSLPPFPVLVRCNTYNQSGYIVDALSGFSMQQTNFPFVCFVIDDASTDGEQEVIQKRRGCFLIFQYKMLMFICKLV